MSLKSHALAAVAFLCLLVVGGALADGAGASADVPLMDPKLYREVLFPGYEAWNAVWDLHASGSSVYIALCSEGIAAESARLFRYDIATGEKRIILDPDRAAGIRLESGVMPQSKFHTAIRTLRDGRLFMVTHNTAAGRFHPDWQLENMRHDPTGFSSRAFLYDPVGNAVVYLGAPIPDEDIYYGQVDAERGVYYACGYSTKTLYQIDLATMDATECGDHPCWIAIVVDDDHMVYTSDSQERIWRWDPFRKKSEMTGLRMPHGPFQKESVGSWVYGWKDPDGWIYAVPQYCNRICRFKPKEGLMQDLGNGWREKAHPETELIFAPVRARNGRIYYGVLGGTPPRYEDGTEIIELDPETGRKRNLGTMRLTDGTLACVLGEGALGSDGRIYWGDGNHGLRGGMMWIFDPRDIPASYRPAGYAKRNPRYPEGEENESFRYPITRESPKTGLWRFRPLPGAFRKSTFIADAGLRGGTVTRVPLEAGGLPMGENAVAGLVGASDGYLYGIAGEERPVLFRFRVEDLKPEILAAVPGGTKIVNGSVLASVGSSVFLAGGQVYRWAAGGGGWTVFASLEGEDHAVALAPDSAAPRLYALTEPGNRLLVLDARTGVRLREYRLPGYVASRWLVAAAGGGVVGFENNGAVYRIGPEGGREILVDRVPSTRGLEFVCEVTAAAAGPDGRIWGGTREGYLFSIAGGGRRVVNHGKPGTYYLKGVTVAGGSVYAFGGGDFGDTHLYRFRDGDGFEDLGLISRRLVSAAVAEADGSVVAGEFSSASALLRFVPER